MRNDQSSGSRGQGRSALKIDSEAFAAADEFKSAGSLASSVQLKAQAKLIADPEGEGKPAGETRNPLRVAQTQRRAGQSR